MKEYFLVEIKEYEKLKREKFSNQSDNLNAGNIITTTDSFQQPERGDLSTIRNKNTEAEKSLFQDNVSPETALKLFNHMNKLYENKIRNENKQENKSLDNTVIRSDNNNNNNNDIEFDLDPLYNSFSPGLRKPARELMNHLYSKKLIHIDKYGNLKILKTGESISLATFLRSMITQNSILSVKMKTILKTLLRDIPERYIRNKKVVSLFPVNIGGNISKKRREKNGRYTIKNIPDSRNRIYRGSAWVSY